jgi:hypothetical protein
MKVIIGAAIGWLAFTMLVSLNQEATKGYSIWGCYLRGLHGVNVEVCKND